MKTKIRKQVSLVLVFCMLLSVFSPFPVFAEEGDVLLTLSPSVLTQSDQAQKVTMNVKVKTEGLSGGYNYTYIAKAPSEISIISPNTGDVKKVTVIDGYTDLGNVEFLIPAGTVGTVVLGIEDLILQKANDSYSEKAVYENIAQQAELTVQEASQGNTVSLSGPDSAVVGSEVVYTVTVSSDNFASADIRLTYDPTCLEFDAQKSAGSAAVKDAEISIVDYGESKSSGHRYTLTFRATKAGNTGLTLTSAKFGAPGAAANNDMVIGTITEGTVTTEIHEASHTVTLPDGVTGASTVEHDGTYSFTVNDFEPQLFDYKVTATVNGNEKTVTDNGNGSYAVSNVTGPLAITVEKTARSFEVTFSGEGITGLPTGVNAVYGTDYTYTLPTAQPNHRIEVTAVTIGGTAYTRYIVENGELTIPGADIKGDIAITLRQTQVAYQVSVSGNAAGEVKYTTTAAAGEKYTFTITKTDNYTYTVTAQMGDSAVNVTETNGSYTLEEATSGDIHITVEKSLNVGELSATQYFNADGKTAYLIKNKTAKLDGYVYMYKEQKMFWSEKYQAYCCLVFADGAMTQPAAADFSITTGSATEIDYGGDVNMTGTKDANDAQLIYDLYNARYDSFAAVTMEKFLRADVNGDGMLNVQDAAAVVSSIR